MAKVESSNNYLQWRSKFEKVLNNAIAAEIGEGLDKYRRGSSPDVVLKRTVQGLRTQKDEIGKFLESFVSLCQKHGITDGQGRWPIHMNGNLPNTVYPLCRRFGSSINKIRKHVESEYQQRADEQNKRRRPRIPNEVAQQIIELFETCKGNKPRAAMVAKLMRPKKDLDSLIRTIADNQKSRTLASLSRSLRSEQQKLQQPNLSVVEKTKVKKNVSQIRKNISRVNAYKAKWNPFETLRDMDPQHQWMSKMKRHLKNSITASIAGKARIRTLS